MRKAFVVGLTGGIGSGKSTVSRLLKDFGAVVIDADDAARAVVAKGTEGLEAIAREFGPEVLTLDGELDRAAMARRIFSSEADRKRLEAIVHPLVFQRMRSALLEAESASRIIILDVPLLFESGRFLNLVDKTLVVYTDPKTQLARLVERDGLSEAEAVRRIAAQAPLADKVERADYTVYNTGSLAATQAQVTALWKEWTTKHADRSDCS